MESNRGSLIVAAATGCCGCALHRRIVEWVTFCPSQVQAPSSLGEIADGRKPWQRPKLDSRNCARSQTMRKHMCDPEWSRSERRLSMTAMARNIAHAVETIVATSKNCSTDKTLLKRTREKHMFARPPRMLTKRTPTCYDCNGSKHFAFGRNHSRNFEEL